MRPSISHKCTAVMDVQALPTSFISVLGSNLSLSVVRSYHPSPKIKQTDSSFFFIILVSSVLFVKDMNN